MHLNRIVIFIMSILLVSCVTSKKYNDLEAKKNETDKENKRLRAQMEASTQQLQSSIDDLEKQRKQLQSDTTSLGASARKMNVELLSQKRIQQELQSRNELLNNTKTEEAKKLIAQLQTTQEDLIKKEDQLKLTDQQLAQKDKELKEREQKLKELQSILSRKDSAVNALRATVANALLGFENKGLTIVQKNGKVYISLEEQLLFASGSTIVDKKGEEALRQLAKVLEKNQDINVMIEGHTDNVPISGGAIKDNWDLSVMRATAIVRILRDNSKIDPKRLIAAGRAEFLPIDPANTPEAKKKNRRTEIILTPKLDELFKVLETN
jgi:chemotaxis protein MotB